MATNPKMKPCPKCNTDEHLAVYGYDSGAKHVECDKCFRPLFRSATRGKP